MIFKQDDPGLAGFPAGFTTRPAALEDAQGVTDLLNAESLATVGTTRFSLEECLQEWDSPGFDLAESSVMVFAPDGRLAGYCELWDTEETPTFSFLLGATHPEFWGQGIGSSLVAWGERLARRTLARVPADVRVAVGSAAPASDNGSNQMLADMGMTHIRSYWTMRIDFDGEPLEKAPLPSDIVIKSLAETGDPWPIYMAAHEAFQDHFGYKEKSEEELRRVVQHRVNDPSFDPSLWFVALKGDEIAGASLCSPKADEDPTIGFVGKLGVRQPFRRQGIALALLQHSFQTFVNRPDYQAVMLTVDTGNSTGAIRLYEKAGMHVLRETRLYEKVLRDGRLIEKR